MVSLITRDQSVALALGQFISVLLTATGVITQLLYASKHVQIPAGQTWLNYLLLAVRHSLQSFYYCLIFDPFGGDAVLLIEFHQLT